MNATIETLAIEINHSDMDGRRIRLVPHKDGDGSYTWQLSDGSEYDDNQPHWHTADEGKAVAEQLWGLADWELEVIDRDPPAVEVCNSVEWLRLYWLGATHIDADDAAIELSDRIFARLIDAGYCVENPRGQRALCHGWNGAKFAWKYGPAGTFADLTASQRKEIEQIVDAATAEVKADFELAT